MKKSLLLFTALLGFFAISNAQFSIQKVVAEEFTGAWCPYCADGDAIMKSIASNYEKAIPITIHTGDAMEVQEGTDLAAFYSPNYPMALVNRENAPIGRGTWSSAIASATQGASVVSVSINNSVWVDATRTIDFDVDISFTGAASGDMRFNVFVVQDEMTGSGNGWDQANSEQGTLGHMYYQAGNPIPNFLHTHVLRDMLDGVWGAAGIIPTTAAFGTTATNHYSFTVPASWDETGLEFVAVVQRFDGNGMADREILNAEEFHLSSLTVALDELNSNSNYIDVMPNPVNDFSKIQFSLEASGMIRLEVLNTNGQHVANLGEGHMNAGVHTLTWDATNDVKQPVASGIYMVRLVTENGQSMTKRIMVAK